MTFEYEELVGLCPRLETVPIIRVPLVRGVFLLIFFLLGLVGAVAR